jgi:hypothetical protein
MSKREQQINNKRRRRFLSHQKGNEHIKLEIEKRIKNYFSTPSSL